MKKQQRSEAKAECASSAKDNTTWKDIDFHKCECKVRKLQIRIAKAHTGKRYNKVKALQFLLVTSFEAKALAVRKVTSNKGKRTAGVDHIKWDTDARKIEAIRSLTRRGYKALPLKRVNIPKTNGKTRPLGIPTMKDRAMQALYLMALEPITENEADANSYGFRKFRSTADAIDALHRWLSKDCSPEWILEGDIKGFFDNLNHDWIMKFISSRITDNSVLRLVEKMLKAGILKNGEFYVNEFGAGQGSVCSPIIANIYMHYVLVWWFNEKIRPLLKGYADIVVYADDFVCCFQYKNDAELLYEHLKRRMNHFGLSLEESKTRLIYFGRFAADNLKRQGNKPETFDFLGFTHYCSKSRNGNFRVKHKTANKKYR